MPKTVYEYHYFEYLLSEIKKASATLYTLANEDDPQVALIAAVNLAKYTNLFSENLHHLEAHYLPKLYSIANEKSLKDIQKRLINHTIDKALNDPDQYNIYAVLDTLQLCSNKEHIDIIKENKQKLTIPVDEAQARLIGKALASGKTIPQNIQEMYENNKNNIDKIVRFKCEQAMIRLAISNKLARKNPILCNISRDEALQTLSQLAKDPRSSFHLINNYMQMLYDGRYFFNMKNNKQFVEPLLHLRRLSFLGTPEQKTTCYNSFFTQALKCITLQRYHNDTHNRENCFEFYYQQAMIEENDLAVEILSKQNPNKFYDMLMQDQRYDLLTPIQLLNGLTKIKTYLGNSSQTLSSPLYEKVCETRKALLESSAMLKIAKENGHGFNKHCISWVSSDSEDSEDEPDCKNILSGKQEEEEAPAYEARRFT